ncbi:hypothetical protein [Novosphingobium sp. B 225]|uniref:hypothetical protein n=1 Tax=Novosphingobium sp. B 225 TaxID=1961849 RepID=UPI001124E4EE|nr:hypothetical protein [Novosphingobium sp. B 225]
MARYACLALLALIAAPALAAPAKPAAQAVTCSLPVGPKDTWTTVRKRFGAAALLSKIPGPEGTELNGIILWDKDPVRRLELILTDDKYRTVSDVRITDSSRWSAGGLRLGDSMAKVQQLNGKPFKLYGFDWDYGGYVNDMARGKLQKLPGGCSLSIRFGPSVTKNYPDGISGDTILSSADPKVQSVKPVIEELTLGW